MFDAVLPAKAVLVGGLVAAAVMLLASWKSPRPWRSSVRWSWAVGAGVLAASGASGQWPHWPPLEDRARFLTLLVPLILVIETIAAIMRPGRGVWILRLGLGAFVTPILLYDTVYMADLNGPNSAEWSYVEATVILCGLAALLTLVWALLSSLQSRTSAPAVMWVLVLDALATAVTVMLSGYYGGGLLGVGLTGAVAGVTLASSVTQPRLASGMSLGMSVIGIFAVLLLGRFFGDLPTSLAACLLFAPLLAWTAELRRLRTLGRGWRTALRLSFVAVPLTIVVILAQRTFTAASIAPSRSFEPDTIRERLEK